MDLDKQDVAQRMCLYVHYHYPLVYTCGSSSVSYGCTNHATTKDACACLQVIAVAQTAITCKHAPASQLCTCENPLIYIRGLSPGTNAQTME